MKAQKVSFDSQAIGFLDELAAFLDPGENMIVTYEDGKYFVEFEREENIDEFNFPDDLLPMLRRVS